jgi:hypothetical protein
MIPAAATLPSMKAAHSRQRSIRRHCRGLTLKDATRYAVDICFSFSCRATESKSLWSETERVWLGRETFLHWSICLADINIPAAVNSAISAPEDNDQLCNAVRAELIDYWVEKIAALPRRTRPRWLPLP